MCNFYINYNKFTVNRVFRRFYEKSKVYFSYGRVLKRLFH